MPTETPVTLHEVLGGSERDLEDLLRIHTELFPSYFYYQPYMRERATQPPHSNPSQIEHWWLARVGGRAAAIHLFKTIPARRWGLVLALGVRPEYRPVSVGPHRRFAEFLLRRGLGHMRADARSAGQEPLLGMAVETEEPLLARYQEYGFVRVPVTYAEPPFTQEAQAYLAQPQSSPSGLHPMHVCVFLTDRRQYDQFNSDAIRDLARALLVDHYGLSEDHWLARQTFDSIGETPG